MGIILNLTIDHPGITLLSKHFNCQEEELKIEIKLFKGNNTIPIETF